MPTPVTLVHLTTGHVLTAVASPGTVPALEDLVGDSLPVRYLPNDGSYLEFVFVPRSALAATVVSIDDGEARDLLDRPQNYVLMPGDTAPTEGIGPHHAPFNPIVEVSKNAKGVIVLQPLNGVATSHQVQFTDKGQLPADLDTDGARLQLVAFPKGPIWITLLTTH